MTGYTSGILTVPFASYLRSSIKYLNTKRLKCGITIHLAIYLIERPKQFLVLAKLPE